MKRNLTIVDVETTGGSPFFHRVIELGILRARGGEIVESYHSLVNPGFPIPEFITRITGIGDADVASAPGFEDLAEDVLGFFDDAVLVAHNSSFDYGFLRREFGRLGWNFGVPSLCTVRLSRDLFPQHRRHNLSAIIERCGLTCPRRHRALDDARAVWDFLRHSQACLGPERLSQAMDQALRPAVKSYFFQEAVLE